MAQTVPGHKVKLPIEKRTSQGLYHCPKNKSARRSFKRYRGQGRP